MVRTNVSGVIESTATEPDQEFAGGGGDGGFSPVLLGAPVDFTGLIRM
jgi:hypothetical protein